MGYGVVVTAHQVVKTCFCVLIITSVTERIQITDMVRVCNCISVIIGYRNHITPSIIFIMCFEFACTIVNPDNITTGIVGVVVGILGTAVSQSVSDIIQNSVCIVGIIELCVATSFIHKLSVKISICVFYSVYGFSCTNTTAVIAIAYACITICECCKLSAVLPCH